MRALDILTLSSRQIKERRLRSILTTLAIAVGVTTIIALSAQVEGVREAIIQNLATLGPETVIVQARGNMPFTDADVSRLKGLGGVSTVTPLLIVNVRVTGLEDPVTLVGISSLNLASLLGEVRLLDGSVYLDVPAPQALIGYTVAIDEVGQTRYEPGQPILVQLEQRPIMMTVIGVLDDYGTMLMIQPENSVFIPMEYVKTLVRGGGYGIVMVEAASAEDVDQLVEVVGYVFGGRASVTSMKQITETVISITSQINLLLIVIAGTSFIAAGLGTFNIMMISVLERVREIGILKALGMKDKGVLSLYLIQGALVGALGSLAGIGLGFAVAYVIPLLLGGFMTGSTVGGGPAGGPGHVSSFSFAPIVSLSNIGLAVSISIAVTLLSSLYPAWRASRLRPVEALRYE